MGSTSVSRQQYTITHEGWCQKFGQVSYVTVSTNPQFQGIRIVMDADSVQQTWQAWQKMVELLSSQQEIKDLMVFPISYNWNDEGSICDYQNERKSTYELVYNSFFTTLANELKLRMEKKIHFQQTEVWYIGYILLKVSAFFQTRSWHLGNIHSNNIMIDKQGVVKVFTTFSSPTERENYELIKESKYSDAFLAPEQINVLSKEGKNKEINPSKIDTYYIGLVLLSLVCLKDLYFVFNHRESTIKLEVLGQLLLKLKRSRDKYSSPLYNFVESMLEHDPEERNTPLDYYQILKKYEKGIVQMNGIDFQNTSITEFSFRNKKLEHKRRHHIKQITFLTLSKKYKEEAFRTKQKIGKFIQEFPNQNVKTNQKFSEFQQ